MDASYGRMFICIRGCKMKRITAIIPLAPDRQLEILESFEKLKGEIEFIIEKGSNPSANRNKGIKKAKTEFVAFLNAHTILTENWVREVKNFFERNPHIDVVGGPQLTSKGEPLFVRASGYALSSIFGAAEASTRYTPRNLNLDANEKHLTSANLICRKEVVKKVKFDESLYPGEDPKFIADTKEAGFKIAYSPNIYVYHKRRTNFKDLIRQIFSYGRVRPQKESFVETLTKPIFLVPSIFVVYLALLPTLSLIHAVFLLPIIAYILLTVFFSVHETAKKKDFPAMAMMPLLFLSIHISYGIGFIYGSIKDGSKKKVSS